LTDFENAALTVMTVLLSRVLLYFRLNLYVPLSKVDENMATAHTRDAVLTERFWFRKHMADVEADTAGTEEPEYELMTISEILTGKGAHFPGLLPLVFAYLDSIGCDTATRDTVRRYAKLLEKRATGQVQTTASFIRHFVKSHPAYKHDSVVSQEIAHDLMMAGAAIGERSLDAPQHSLSRSVFFSLPFPPSPSLSLLQTYAHTHTHTHTHTQVRLSARAGSMHPNFSATW